MISPIALHEIFMSVCIAGNFSIAVHVMSELIEDD